MTYFNYGKHQATANKVCEKGRFLPDELDFLLTAFDYDEQWGVTVEQRLIRLGVLDDTGLDEIITEWRRWLEELERLAREEERSLEREAMQRIQELPDRNVKNKMMIFMWHAYDYSESDFEQFRSLVKTATRVRGLNANPKIKALLMAYDGSTRAMFDVLVIFEPYKKHIEGPMKRKHDARLSPSGARTASERLDAIRLKYSDDIN